MPRPPLKVTTASIERAALKYLERYATSSANLRRVLIGKVLRSAHHHGTDVDEGREAVDELIARFVGAGYLDDAAYATNRAASLARRGVSLRFIRGRLHEKGVAAGIIDDAIEALGPDRQSSELAAAIRFAKRRRFGPWARNAIAPDKQTKTSTPPGKSPRDKQLAAMGRAGFSYDTARHVVDAQSIQSLETELSFPE